jgi:hypothetical protein
MSRLITSGAGAFRAFGQQNGSESPVIVLVA